MELTIRPDAAATLAEETDDPELARRFEHIAESGEQYSAEVPYDMVERLIGRVALREVADNLDEVSEGLTRYDAGRLRGVVEALLVADRELDCDITNLSNEEMDELLPNAVFEEG